MARDVADTPPSERAVPWEVPAMAPAGKGVISQDLFTGTLSPPTAADVAAWEEAGRREGHARGFAQGQREAEAQNAATAAALGSLLAAMQNALHDFDEEAERELVRLAVVLAQQLVRRELHLHPGEVIPVVREALGLLPSGARTLRVHLHPEDVAILRKFGVAGDGEGGPQLSEDPLITRGGCRIEAGDSRIDATLESRLAALAAGALGGTRRDD